MEKLVIIQGNHDWHYEGMSGELDALRDTWINNRLHSLYQGNNPLMACNNHDRSRNGFLDGNIDSFLKSYLMSRGKD